MTASLRLITLHDTATPATELFSELAEALECEGFSNMKWCAARASLEERYAGGIATYAKHIAAHPDAGFMFEMYFAGVTLDAHRVPKHDDAWLVSIHETTFQPTDEAFSHRLVGLMRRLVTLPSIQHASIRRSPSTLEFPLSPPIAAGNHAVMTTDAEVAAAYEDPSVFWDAWTNVEAIGERLLCTRHLGAIHEADWLEATFDHTMAMARAARPKRTEFGRRNIVPYMKRWWAFGDVNEGNAGERVLDFVGYVPDEALVEYASYLERGRHVLVQEIYNIRELLLGEKSSEGHPVRTVRVVFAEKWMAVSERRPLLDVGARVFYSDPGAPDIVELVE